VESSSIDGSAKLIKPRMAGWVRLSIQCMDYEYPSWHLLLSFSIFYLSSKLGGKRTHGFGDDFVQTSCERLAVAFRVSPSELQSQYNDHLAFAIAHYRKNEEEGFASAWAASIKRPGGMRLVLSAALRQAVHGLQAWDGFTSSEVERGFAAIRRLLGKHRDQLTDVRQSEIIKVAIDIPQSMHKEVIHGARKLWLQLWGCERLAGKAQRTNFRAPQSATDLKGKKLTETGFLRRRRAAVQAGVLLHGKDKSITRAGVLDEAKIMSSAMWTDQQQTAEDNLRGRQATSLAQAAMGDNVLMSSEKTPAVMKEVSAEKLRRAQLDREHDRDRRRVQGKLACLRADVQGLPTHFSCNLLADDLAKCTAKLRRADLNMDSARRHEAIVFVVPDVSVPGYHIALTTCICGGLVVNPAYFLANSAAGVAMSYKPASLSRRKIYLTPAFCARYPPLVETFDKCVVSAKWARVLNADDVVAYHEKDAARPAKRRRPFGMLVLCLVSEKSDGPLAEKRWAMTLNAFLTFCKQPGCSTKGTSGL